MMALSYKAALQAPLLERDEERRAILCWQQANDRPSLELLLRSHARQVYALAHKWSSNATEREDLVAEGMIGLMRAADMFDLQQDVRFATYSQWWVTNCISIALARLKTVIDMPTRTYFEARMGRLNGRADEMAVQALRGVISLDAPRFDDGSDLGLDMLHSAELTPEEHAEAASTTAMLRLLLQRALDEMGDPDREILVWRKLTAQPSTLDEISARLGISREHARMVERRALARLKRCLEKQGFTPSMLG